MNTAPRMGRTTRTDTEACLESRRACRGASCASLQRRESPQLGDCLDLWLGMRSGCAAPSAGASSRTEREAPSRLAGHRRACRQRRTIRGGCRRLRRRQGRSSDARKPGLRAPATDSDQAGRRPAPTASRLETTPWSSALVRRVRGLRVSGQWPVASGQGETDPPSDTKTDPLLIRHS